VDLDQQPITTEEIDEVLAAVRAAWLATPHLLLGELIDNCSRDGVVYFGRGALNSSLVASLRKWERDHSPPAPALSAQDATQCHLDVYGVPVCVTGLPILGIRNWLNAVRGSSFDDAASLVLADDADDEEEAKERAKAIRAWRPPTS